MADHTQDPWVNVRTRHDFPADEIISALQKEVRRGNTENAVLLAYEMVTTSPELEAYLWRRLLVISVEDVGFGDPQAPILVHTLHQIIEPLGPGAGERLLFAFHPEQWGDVERLQLLRKLLIGRIRILTDQLTTIASEVLTGRIPSSDVMDK